MSKKVMLIGAGGHAKVIADIIIASGDVVLGFYDDYVPKGTEIHGARVLGTLSDLSDAERDIEYILAIGDNTLRKKFAERFPYLPFYTAIHPSAQLGTNVKIGTGSCVMPFAVIQSDSVVGEHCILNTHSVLEHDGQLESFVHLAPGSILCGTVQIGENCMIGAGAIVKNNIKIVSDCTIGAGAVVVENLLTEGAYVGVPARRMI